MSITHTQGERVPVAFLVVKARDDVVQPVRSVEDPVVTVDDLGQRRIVQRSQSGCDSIGKADQERVTGCLERIDVAQLVGSLAGKLGGAVRAQPGGIDSLDLRRIDDVVKEGRIEPLKLVGRKREELVFHDGAAQRKAHVGVLAECLGRTRVKEV